MGSEPEQKGQTEERKEFVKKHPPPREPGSHQERRYSVEPESKKKHGRIICKVRTGIEGVGAAVFIGMQKKLGGAELAVSAVAHTKGEDGSFSKWQRSV